MKKLIIKIFTYYSFKCVIKIINLYMIISVIICKKESVILYNKNINHYEINFLNSNQNDNSNIFFNISFFRHSFNNNLSKVELKYNFQFFDKQNNLIFPSDLSLYYNLHTFCILKQRNINLLSISNIQQNKYFSCVEYYKLNQPTKFGIKICYDSSQCRSFYFFENEIFNYNYTKFFNEYKFDFNYINKEYSSISHKIKKTQSNSYLLKKCYISQPICSTKEEAITYKNTWYFKNIYNHYFCYCNGYNCKFDQNFDDCKYYLYLIIIDSNKHLYKKTYYLLVDFLYANRAPGDAYFIFKEMIKQNMSAFYFTERRDIYKEYYDNKTNFQKIIPIINKHYNITGNFLEKYLTLFLRLKSVISGSEFFSKENIFFNIPYITYICLGHGVNYFKPFLYEEYYGCKRYNKIILPSEKIISIAKQYGWKEKDIIKVGLPKWDIFDNYSLEMKNKSNEKCIFMMFTWRKLNEGKNISPDYFNNIFKLLNDPLLIEILNKKNITLYLSLHHNLLNKQNLIKGKTKAKYTNQEEILSCLMKCDLIVSDFSSVIFDLMYRNKPFIIFIPDANDKNIDDLYDYDYSNVINGLKNDSIKFENKVFNVENAVKKIKYYIKNDFHLDLKLKSFYKKFNLNHKQNINRFIAYLKSSI